MRSALFLLLLCGSAHANDLVSQRPFFARVPKSYVATKAAPLIVLLHPYYPGGGERALQMYDLAPILDDKGVLLAAPDGLVERGSDMRYWNATDACCDFGHSNVDDVAYLDAVVADMRARYRVDAKRIFVMGFSNGGFMTHRLLCDRAGTYAAGASLGGAAWKDAGRCRPAAPSSLVEIHGDADRVVAYEGGSFRSGAPSPSSAQGIADWAKAIDCGSASTGDARDLIPSLPGAETSVTRYACRAGAAELWTVHGGSHLGVIPAMRAAIDFLLAHPRR